METNALALSRALLVGYCYLESLLGLDTGQ